LTEEILAIHDESTGTYGTPRLHAELRDRGRRQSRKRPAGRAGRSPKRWRTTTIADPAATTPAGLVRRDFSCSATNIVSGHGDRPRVAADWRTHVDRGAPGNRGATVACGNLVHQEASGPKHVAETATVQAAQRGHRIGHGGRPDQVHTLLGKTGCGAGGCEVATVTTHVSAWSTGRFAIRAVCTSVSFSAPVPQSRNRRHGVGSRVRPHASFIVNAADRYRATSESAIRTQPATAPIVELPVKVAAATV
jgi:hypothetical protein